MDADTSLQTDTLPDLLGGQFIVDREIDVELDPIVGFVSLGISF